MYYIENKTQKTWYKIWGNNMRNVSVTSWKEEMPHVGCHIPYALLICRVWEKPDKKAGLVCIPKKAESERRQDKICNAINSLMQPLNSFLIHNFSQPALVVSPITKVGSGFLPY